MQVLIDAGKLRPLGSSGSRGPKRSAIEANAEGRFACRIPECDRTYSCAMTLSVHVKREHPEQWLQQRGTHPAIGPAEQPYSRVPLAFSENINHDTTAQLPENDSYKSQVIASKRCRCGSTTHLRPNHADCPLNRAHRTQLQGLIDQGQLPSIAQRVAVPAHDNIQKIGKRPDQIPMLPDGWVATEHVSSTGASIYKRYLGPDGQRVQSVREAWKVHAQSAPDASGHNHAHATSHLAQPRYSGGSLASLANDPRMAASGMAPGMAPGIAPGIAAPVLATPVMAAPVLAAPVLAAPVLAAPVMAAPVLAAPVMTAPVMAAAVMAAPAMAAFSASHCQIKVYSHGGIIQPNQSKQCRCGSTSHSRPNHADCPLRKAIQCRCGSTTHLRPNHADCPLNKASQATPHQSIPTALVSAVPTLTATANDPRDAYGGDTVALSNHEQIVCAARGLQQTLRLTLAQFAERVEAHNPSIVWHSRVSATTISNWMNTVRMTPQTMIEHDTRLKQMIEAHQPASPEDTEEPWEELD